MVFVGNACNGTGSYEPKSSKHSVRCCTFNGSQCEIPNNRLCSKIMIFDDAEVECENLGLRLCSKEELKTECCSELSCNSKSVWTLTHGKKYFLFTFILPIESNINIHFCTQILALMK